MNGYEACSLIHKIILEGLSLIEVRKKILIYALTADVSNEVKMVIKNYPFTKAFDCLRNEEEVKQINLDIKCNKI